MEPDNGYSQFAEVPFEKIGQQIKRSYYRALEASHHKRLYGGKKSVAAEKYGRQQDKQPDEPENNVNRRTLPGYN